MKKMIASVALGVILMGGFLFLQENQQSDLVHGGEAHPPIFQKATSFSVNL
ncbi:hypothetical protein [Ornithinibacillus bavariensis]|uniref:Uncharacterized protein n=1 Tax=Ornithinibacillus bavariensis TaxID=545502 RepID=A0A919XAS7_9BACI|nr:hypothetical protein [Ornithinibacillus bavariensis]GIO27998.1 hypothetical protein J43TS3_26090 [Ornithinibacillus bavariensis]